MRTKGLLVVLLLFFVWSSFGQETRGVIAGTVTDPQSSAVVGASVAVTNTDTNVSTQLTTNATGYYEARLLVPGGYQVTVEAPGFKKVVRSGLTLGLGQQLQIDLRLEVGAVSDSVTVTAEAPILDTSTVTTGKVMTTRELMDLPVITNNVIMMSRMAPGVEVQNTTQYLTMGMTGGGSGFSMALGIGDNEWTLDGVPNSRGSGLGYMPHTDLVEEFKVETSNFDAAFGHSVGLNVSFTSKSGSNQPHGTASEQYWNMHWNADPFFVKQNYYQQIAQLRAAGNNAAADALASKPRRSGGLSNNYAATFTGPVYIPKVFDGRNKLFFYLGFSQAHDRQPARSSEMNANVPTDAARQGDFSDLLRIDPKYTVYDPLSIRPDPARPTHYVRTPFTGNLVPKNRWNNPSLNFYDQRLPHANANPTDPKLEPLNNYIASSMPDNTNYTGWMNRIDYQLTDKQRIFFRWTWSNFYEDAQDWTYATERGYRSWDQYRKNVLGVVDWTYAMNPSTVLNVEVAGTTGWNSSKHFGVQKYKPSDVGFPKYMDDKCASLPGAAGNGCAVPRALWDGYYNSSGVGGEMSVSVGTLPRNSLLTLKSNLSHIRGSHSLRGGVDIRMSYATSSGGGGNSSGYFLYSNTYTRKDDDGLAAAGTLGLSYAAFLLGLPSSMSLETNSGYAAVAPYYGWYLQDTWRVSRNLTLTPGLRIEYEGGPTERYNQALTYFDRNATLPIADAAVAAYTKSPLTELSPSNFVVKGGPLYANTGGAPRNFWQGELMILPRLSAAWQFSPKMVLRGGYGIYYNPSGVSTGNRFGYSRTTDTTLTDDYGMTWRVGDPANGVSPLKDPFPVRSDGTRFDVPFGNALGTSAYLGQNFSDTPYGREHGRVQRWRVGIQRQLSDNMVVEAAYWGQAGDRLSVNRNLRALPEKYWATGLVRNNAIATDMNQNVTNPFSIANFASLKTSNPLLYQQISTLSFFTSPTARKNQILRAYPQMSGLTSPLYDGKARSHSLELSFQRRMSKGFNLSAAYTRAMGETWSTIVNEFDPAPKSWLPSDSPRNHRLVATAIYEFPFGKGRAFLKSGILSYIVGGFQTAVSYELQTGPILSWGNYFYYGDFGTLPQDLTKGTKTLNSWFNTALPFEKSSSKNPAAYHVRIFPMDITSVRGDGISVWNGNIRRNFQITEKLRFEFRLDALNLQNRSQMSNPSTNPTSTDFGRITSQTSSINRWLQIQGRFQF